MNFKQFIDINEETDMREWADKMLVEASSTASRYSVEVNFRTNKKELFESFAKISLGYVSAAMKQNGYHVKQYFEDSPMRIIVSTRNWDEGEWVGTATFNPNIDNGTFVLSKGFWNRDRKTVSIQNSKKCEGCSAADVTKDLRQLMQSVKGEKGRDKDNLRPISKR